MGEGGEKPDGAAGGVAGVLSTFYVLVLVMEIYIHTNTTHLVFLLATENQNIVCNHIYLNGLKFVFLAC